MTERQIVAMGGGGFFTDETALDDYVLRLTGKTLPQVCMLATASHDSRRFLARFYDAFEGRARPSHLRLFPRTVTDLGEFLLQQDVIYVGGGNAGTLLETWRQQGLEGPLRSAWEAGVILCGPSAGGICWFEGGLVASVGPKPTPLRGLGFLPGTFCPHYEEAQRRVVYHRALIDGMPSGFGAESGTALHFVGSELAGAVSSDPEAHVYRVAAVDGKIEEQALPARYVG
ncbi:MAG: peptidase E [Chloroflexi bacterium]|nr:peptidase E [Chloroflexota bacterium]